MQRISEQFACLKGSADFFQMKTVTSCMHIHGFTQGVPIQPAGLVFPQQSDIQTEQRKKAVEGNKIEGMPCMTENELCHLFRYSLCPVCHEHAFFWKQLLFLRFSFSYLCKTGIRMCLSDTGQAWMRKHGALLPVYSVLCSYLTFL